MNYAIDGALIDQGFGDLDRKEIDSSLFGVIEERRLDEALDFLRRQRVTYAVPRRRILRHRFVVGILRCSVAAAGEEDELGQTISDFFPFFFNFCR